MNRWVARWRLEQQVRAHRWRPVVTVQVRERVAVASSSAMTWSFLTDRGNDPLVLGPHHVRSFVVPGTPTGTVGEVQGTVMRRADGSWDVSLGEVVERTEGVRLAVRAHRPVHGHVETVTVGDGELIWEVAAETHRAQAAAVRAQWSAALPAHLARIAAVLAGDEPPPHAPPADATCDRTGPLVDVEVSRTRRVAASPAAVWDLVSNSRNVALESWDRRAVSFTVPGSPRGEVGELVCLVTGTRAGGRTAVLEEVVRLDPGRSLVRRGRTDVVAHAWDREISVGPAPGGALVTHRVRVPAHWEDAAYVRSEHSRAVARHLAVVKATLARRAAATTSR